ncbi:MAG TPA: nicotinate-nucleotide adenylyltransferase, partial [Gemmataceae bacterium]|nr:nicotinate-nucleotide adenylyltransferase [Gemmataceae bacterium]
LMRIGILGGTFDPVHLGHLILAENGREQGRLDRVWFIPAAAPPHKLERPITPFERRVEMLRLAIVGNPAFEVNELEKDRPGPSYTVDTLTELRRRHPGDEFFLLIGSDTLADLAMWREPGRIVQMAGLLVWPRPGHPLRTAEQLRAALGLPESVAVRLQVVEGPLIDISSTDLRRRAALGRTLRYLVPRAVEQYILEKRLYRDVDPPRAEHPAAHPPPADEEKP